MTTIYYGQPQPGMMYGDPNSNTVYVGQAGLMMQPMQQAGVYTANPLQVAMVGASVGSIQYAPQQQQVRLISNSRTC